MDEREGLLEWQAAQLEKGLKTYVQEQQDKAVQSVSPALREENLGLGAVLHLLITPTPTRGNLTASQIPLDKHVQLEL